MKKMNRRQKRNLLLVFAFIALGTAMLSVGVKHSDYITAKWDEITEKFEKDDVEDTEKTPEVEAGEDEAGTEEQ